LQTLFGCAELLIDLRCRRGRQSNQNLRQLIFLLTNNSLREEKMKRATVVVFSLLASSVLVPGTASALPTCSQLATDPSYGLAGHPHVNLLTASLTGTGSSVRCEVNFTFSSRGGPEFGYEEGEQQQIRIRVGLPVSSVDGGTGGTAQGAWNGRTRGLGGGVCVGSVGSVTPATSAGYVGSSTDSGHVGASCLFALAPNPNRLNIGRLKDFIVDSLVAQVRWSKSIAGTYYGIAPIRNYWDGCSTGGRQGMALAQEYPEELDGWLVGAPAVNYGRFRTAQMWGPLVMRDVAGGPIAVAKLNQATASAVAACDALDGVSDGLLNDPRRCAWSAANNICGNPGAPATNCLTETEAKAIDLIWDGPRNKWGKKIFPGISRGASLGALNGTIPFAAGTSQIQWNHADASFDWQTLTMNDYAAEAELGSQTNGDIINTMSTSLKKVRDSGKKILMWQGEADQLITIENSLNYYTRVAADLNHGTPDFAPLQSWYRYFRAPGVAHCGGGSGPQPPNDLFQVMVNWVENGVVPDQLLASSAGRTRPLCPFPQVAIYNGSGSTDDAANFHCGGDLQTKEAICAGLVTKYKKESQNAYDTMGKYNVAACNANASAAVQ
jgi:hypothetical protein